MHADAVVLKFLAECNLTGLDMMRRDKSAHLASDYLLLRMNGEESWYPEPEWTRETVKSAGALLQHARTFDPRIPKIPGEVGYKE